MSLEKMASFFLSETPRLRQLMKIPPNGPVRVRIIDDYWTAIVPLRVLLSLWDNISASAVAQEAGQMPYLDLDCDIYLIDEELDRLHGSQIVDELRHCGFAGIIACIGQCDEKPEGVKFHFKTKTLIGSDVGITHEFVAFMNMLIEEVLRDRMEEPAGGKHGTSPKQLKMFLPPR